MHDQAMSKGDNEMTQSKIHKATLAMTLTILLLSIAAPFAQAQEAAGERSARQDLEEIIVSATRTTRSDKAIPNKVTRIDAEEIALQTPLTLNPSDLLSNMLPSFSPPRQKLDDQGESFRGRSPLYLIDGVPQSNPLRDGSRDGFTIDMSVVEEIEVIHGANAIQGLGATGGIINFITVRPPTSGELEQRVSAGMTADDGFDSDGFGYRGQYLIGKRSGDWDGVASVSYEKRGLTFDGEGRPIGVETTQGDVADSTSMNFFAKVGYEPSDTQRVQLMINRFDLEMDADFINVDGDRAAGIPTTAAPGSEPGDPAANEVTTVTVNYANTELFGGRFTGQVYIQDFAGTYGGGTFGIFQDPAFAPVGTLFDQSQNNSEKFGLRLTQAYRGIFDTPLNLIFGIDFLADETRQTLIQTGRNWVPETSFNNTAPFFQLDFEATDWLSFTGGARFEIAELDAPSFVTLAGNRADLQVLTVDGGKPDFDDTLVNFGTVIRPTDAWSFYGTYSEGFTMPDVGRVLRGVSEPGTDVDTFLDLAPLVTENFEVGIEYASDWGGAQLAWYDSSTDFGVRLVANADGIFEVNREKTTVEGWELSFNATVTEWLDFGIAYSDLTGEFDSDGDGSVDADLDAINVAPDRLNLFFDITPDSAWSGRLQVFSYLDKSFRDSAGATTAEFDGYTVVDALASRPIGDMRLTIGIANLLDEQYITYYGQAGNARADRYFAGRGRTLTVGADFRF